MVTVQPELCTCGKLDCYFFSVAFAFCRCLFLTLHRNLMLSHRIFNKI